MHINAQPLIDAEIKIIECKKKNIFASYSMFLGSSLVSRFHSEIPIIIGKSLEFNSNHLFFSLVIVKETVTAAVKLGQRRYNTQMNVILAASLVENYCFYVM